MKNIFIYIISAVLLLGVIAVYAADLIGYGMDVGAVIAIIMAAAVIIILAVVIIRILSKRLYNKDNNKD